MSVLETRSAKINRVYPRKFDHDQARELHAGGVSLRQIARQVGVSRSAVQRVVNPIRRQQVDAATKRTLEAICDDCGGRCSHNWYAKDHRHDRVVCRSCAAKRTRRETLARRLDQDGRIHCSKCDTHRPPSMYRLVRGFPYCWCRPCENAQRRSSRSRTGR